MAVCNGGPVLHLISELCKGLARRVADCWEALSGFVGGYQERECALMSELVLNTGNQTEVLLFS